MKKILMVAIAIIVASVSCLAQTNADQIRQERNEIKKLAKKELSARVDKTTRKASRHLVYAFNNNYYKTYRSMHWLHKDSKKC